MPLRFFAQGEKAMASVVKRICYGPIKGELIVMKWGGGQLEGD
jgi:hypothetical protein